MTTRESTRSTRGRLIGLLSRPGAPWSRMRAGQRALDALLARSDERDPAVLGTCCGAACLPAAPTRRESPRRSSKRPSQADRRACSWGWQLSGLARWMRAGDESDSRIATSSARAISPGASAAVCVQSACLRGHGPSPRADPGVHRLTSFASQVYPVQGLCELAWPPTLPLRARSRRSATYLMESQGERGQWWWFYSTRARKVIEGYPVYSVHQDAMAFLAMLPAIRLLAGRLPARPDPWTAVGHRRQRAQGVPCRSDARADLPCDPTPRG